MHHRLRDWPRSNFIYSSKYPSVLLAIILFDRQTKNSFSCPVSATPPSSPLSLRRYSAAVFLCSRSLSAPVSPPSCRLPLLFDLFPPGHVFSVPSVHAAMAITNMVGQALVTASYIGTLYLYLTYAPLRTHQSCPTYMYTPICHCPNPLQEPELAQLVEPPRYGAGDR